MDNANAIFFQVVDRPARRVILKRGKTATDYFEFCDEVGCNFWDILGNIKGALYEPIGMWMPDNLRPDGTSFYTAGVEVLLGYTGEIPAGYEVLGLPPCKMLFFQGEPYEEDDNFANGGNAIGYLWEQTKNFNPKIYGYDWDDNIAPKIQYAPMGYRGYIEGRPVKEINIDGFRIV